MSDKKELLENLEIWSTGLETWESVVVALDGLTFVHKKPVNGRMYEFYVDSYNRWFRRPKL